MNSIVKELKSGIIIIFVTKYLNIILQLILGGILARLLTPEEYGIVAVVMVFINFFSLLSELGIGPAIIQKKNIEEKDKTELLNLTIILGIILGGIFFYFSYFIANFYNNTAYINIGRILALLIFFNTLSIVPQNILRREKNFKILGEIQIYSTVISSVVAIYLAYKGWSYYAIILQSIISILIQNILSFKKIKIKINFNISFNSLKGIWKYSMYQFFFNFINYFSRNLDNILIGKYISDIALGYYDKAYRLMLYPMGILTSTISSALHPILSQYQDDKDIIFNNYMLVVRILGILGFPLTVYLYFSSTEIINILYGSNWDLAIPVFKILSLSICIQLILSSSGSIYQAVGRTDYLFLSGFLSAITMVSAIIIGVLQRNLEMVSYCLLIAFSINFIQCYYIMIKKIFKKSFFKFILNLKNGIIIGIISLILHVIFSKYLIFNLFINFIIKIFISIIGFALGLYITKEYKEILKIYKKEN